MTYIYRNNAGRFRLEPGVHTFLPPTVSAPGLNANLYIPSTSSSSSTWRPARGFFSGPAAADSRDFLLQSSSLQESCPSINLLSSSGIRNSVTTPAALRKPHSSSAPSEGITGVEPAFSPPIHMLRIMRKRSTSRRPPSLSGGGPVHLENPERETRWYFKYFLGKGDFSFNTFWQLRTHQIYCGNISEKDPLLLAVVKSEFEAEGLRQYRAILWTNLFDIYRLEKGLKEILHYEVQKEVLTLEEQEGSVNFKFGVLYCKEGQTSDEEMYNNENGSSQYQAFLRLLGDRITLKNWDRFKGGLDAKTETTGTESIYTIYEGHEIMFHVSTLLPISTDNRQQVISNRGYLQPKAKHSLFKHQIERKRHIGNDIVNIIFFDASDVEKPLSWGPSMMKTHFTRIL
ncbi:unnamed protein product [Hydatigera taeniaeformis]|uniref:Rap-GAP domain-containing protein n=1 Tax=Hydatigena taeniaeformis TaxID=6205 RepID=A0A0R3WPY2_HYDTA|nr:unnamed protein product [Hydatigera taeniaeformis]